MRLLGVSGTGQPTVAEVLEWARVGRRLRGTTGAPAGENWTPGAGQRWAFHGPFPGHVLAHITSRRLLPNTRASSLVFMGIGESETVGWLLQREFRGLSVSATVTQATGKRWQSV